MHFILACKNKYEGGKKVPGNFYSHQNYNSNCEFLPYMTPLQPNRVSGASCDVPVTRMCRDVIQQGSVLFERKTVRVLGCANSLIANCPFVFVFKWLSVNIGKDNQRDPAKKNYSLN